MVQIKAASYAISMAISTLLYSVSEALPMAGTEIIPSNCTSLPLSQDCFAIPTILQKRSDTVVTATSAQISEYKKYAGIASTAYCKAVVPLKTWSCTQCLKAVPDGKMIKTFTTTINDTNGFVLRSDSDKTIYLVFRGTASSQQTAVDMQGTPVTYTPVSGAKVHSGFYTSLKEAIPSYFSTVQDQLTSYPSYKVVVTGHSLGAAQALLAGLDLLQRDSRVTKSNLFIHTAGSPRVGNSVFAKYVESTGITYSRSIHRYDMVAHVPYTTAGFVHAGVEVWAKTDSNIVICTSTIESKLCSNTASSALWNFQDHLSYYGITIGGC